MLKSLLPVVALAATTILSAQVSIGTDIIPQIGDTLYTTGAVSGQTVDLIDVGGPHFWDFSHLENGAQQARVVEAVDPLVDTDFPQADAKISFGQGTYNYYDINSNSMYLVGYLGAIDLAPDQTIATPFSPPYLERLAPMNFIDQLSNSSNLSVALHTDSLPEFILQAGGAVLEATDSIRVRTAIEQSSIVDAYGSLTVDGETYEVLREKRVETRDIRFDVHSFLGWSDVTSLIGGLLDSLPLGGFVEGLDTVITYNFWTPGRLMPAAYVSTDAQGEILSINYLTSSDNVNSTDDASLQSATIQMFPNPAKEWVNFRATDLPTADYSLGIYNGLGQRLIESHFAKTDRIDYRLNLSELPCGLYYYSLRNGHGRILTTKRLLVGGYSN